MNKTIGFIGGGNMATAMIGGILSDLLVAPTQIMVSDINPRNVLYLAETYGTATGESNTEVARFADILILAVKPIYYPHVIEEIRSNIKENAIIVSIAPGLSLSYLESLFQKLVKIVRAMPNTPALVKEGMSAICAGKGVAREEAEAIESIFKKFGKVQFVAESLMDTVTGVSGSSPAYVYLFIEAMADAAVADGMPRGQAYEFAAQAVLGAAKMVLESDLHPGELKDMVCSPGGTTIEGVTVLEREGLRNAVISAQRACVKKAKEMGK